MKKLSLILLIIVLLIPPKVNAAEQYTQECFYRGFHDVKTGQSWYDYSYMRIGGLMTGGMMSMVLDVSFFKPAGEDLSKEANREYYFKYDAIKATDAIYNFNKDFGIKYTLESHIMTYQDDAIKNQKLIDICPPNMIIVEKDNDYLVFVCGTNDFGDRCSEVGPYLNESLPNHRVVQFMTLYTGVLTGVDWTESNQTNVVDKYKDVEEEIAVVCDKSNSKYDEERCNELRLLQGALEETAGDQGRGDELITPPTISNPPITINPADCSIFNGKIRDLIDETLNFMRYLAPILVIIFSTIDFIKATSSQDKDELKKAQITAAKRLIIAVVLFFVPTILNILLGLFEAVIGNHGTCGF